MRINISRASGVHEPMFSFSQSSFQQPQLLQQPPSKNDEEYRKLVKDLRRIYLAYAETIPPPGQPNVNQNSIVNQNCHFKAVVFKERARLEPLSRPEHMKDSENSKHAATWDAAETKLMESGLAEFYKPNVIYGVKNLLKKASEHNARFGNPKNSDRSDVFVKRLELARKQRTEQEGVSRKSEERLEKIRRSKEMDDDGFIPVRTKHKTRKTTDKGSSRSGGNARSRGEKKNKELKNFYRFQMREEKRETLQSLRDQFEKDKERVAQMKLDRKFSPFA